MRLSYAFAIVLSTSVWAAGASPKAQDQSVADYKPPRNEPTTETSGDQPAVDKAMTSATTPIPRVPPKVLLATANGFVTREDGRFVFGFRNTPLPEVIAAITSVFRATVIYVGLGARTFSGEFRAQTVEQALSCVADGTNLRFSSDGRRWTIREWNGDVTSVPPLSLSTVLKPAAPSRVAEGSSAVKVSSATADR